MIVGAKGGQEQLTLNSIYYLSKPVDDEHLERCLRSALRSTEPAEDNS